MIFLTEHVGVLALHSKLELFHAYVTETLDHLCPSGPDGIAKALLRLHMETLAFDLI